ncbi:YiiX/YebB-like N1pC/P60 family cysteine hydrolase [Kosakonia sacchari]|uniref:YiiX/YebB-like N1pC/P60 family cysteine hydrolase n=1 Tax=Kosakonia sacchari TaxID=1158459 RepID=UPI003F56F948
MYIIDRDLLQIGDVVLTSASTALSKGVRTFTKSDYSHAMIWVGGTLIHSDGGGVYSKNVDRLLFPAPDRVRVLRCKEQLTDEQMLSIITFARSQVGKLYSVKDAINAKLKLNRVANQKQFCSRLVAQSYRNAGIDLVDNADFCSPEEINSSELLYEVENYLNFATSSQIEFSNTVDHNEEIQRNTMTMLENIREAFNPSIQTLSDVLDHLNNHPEHDRPITDFAIESGYFNHAEYDILKNPWRYSDTLFLEHTNNDESLSLYLAGFIENIGNDITTTHLLELYKYQELYKKTPLHFYFEHIRLYKQLLNSHLLRYDVANSIRGHFSV